MAEYIERETALKNIKETIIGASEFANDIRIAAINAVNSAPTADVQEVVRCKNCRSYNNRYGECTLFGAHLGENGYCSAAQK